MGQLAQQLGDRLATGTIVLNTPVDSVEPGMVRAAGVAHRARAVLVATDGSSAAELLGGVRAPSWNGLRTFYSRCQELRRSIRSSRSTRGAGARP